MKLPDITPAQWKVTVGIIATILATFGIDGLTRMQQDTIAGGLVALWAVATIFSDAIIRHGRSTGVGQTEAGVTEDTPPTDAVPEADGNDQAAGQP